MSKTVNEIVEEIKELVREHVFVEERCGAPYVSYENGYSDALTRYFTNLLKISDGGNSSFTPIGEQATNKYGDEMYFTGKIEVPNYGEWYKDDQDMIKECRYYMNTKHEIYSFEKP